jgi:Zn-dependent metalloprotease
MYKRIHIWTMLLMVSMMAVIFSTCAKKPEPMETVEVLVEVPAYEFQEPVSTAESAVEQFRTQYPTAAVSWNPKTGYVKQVSSFVGPVSLTPKDPALSGLQFLKQNNQLFGLNTDRVQLNVATVTQAVGVDDTSVTSRFVHYTQVEQWSRQLLEVYGGEMVVHLTSNNRVHTVYSSFIPLTEIQGDMKIKADDAINRVRNKLKGKPVIVDTAHASLIIYPKRNIGILAWRVIVDHWLGIVDCQNGNIILLVDNARYVNDATVYLENPSVNANTQVMPLTNLDGSGYLTGTRFEVHNDAEAMVNSATNEFHEPPTDANFDDQMVYYHMEKIASYFENDLDALVPQATVTLDIYTRKSDLTCNAYYDPDNALFAFSGPGDIPCEDCECKCSAHYADIIYHEYTHRVLDQLVGLDYNYTESGAIHEGTSDYYSCSILGNGCLSEVWNTCKTCLRNISNKYEYPSDMNNQMHHDGKVWGSALWTLRSKLGDDMTDLIVREGMRGLPHDADFTTYAGNIVVRGTAYYLNMLGDNPWVNLLLILAASAVAEGAKEAFCEHGIPVSYGPFIDMLFQTPPEGHTATQTITLSTGYSVDKGRGCYDGYDILGANSWEDLDYFYDNKSELEQYNVTVTNTSLTVKMEAPEVCGSIDRVWLIYRIYFKKD